MQYHKYTLANFLDFTYKEAIYCYCDIRQSGNYGTPDFGTVN